MTTTGDGNYLALNSTVLTLGVIVLLGVVIVAMIALGGGGLFSKSSSQRFAQEPYQEELYNAEETEFQTRYKRSASGNRIFSYFIVETKNSYWMMYINLYDSDSWVPKYLPRPTDTYNILQCGLGAK